MKGLIIKDLLLIIRSFKVVSCLPIFVVAVLGYLSSQNALFAITLVSLAIAVVFSFYLIETLGLDEISMWNRAVAAMPISVYQEVGSKYVLAGILSILALLVSVMGGIIVCVLFKFSFALLAVIAVVSSLIVLAYDAIMLPIMYRFGIMKSNYVFMAIVYGAVLILLVMRFMGLEPDYMALASSITAITIAIVSLLIVMAASFFLSVAIRNRKRISS